MKLFNKKEKVFIKDKTEIKPLINWQGGNGDGCLATDMITKEGFKVGYMYREVPDEKFPDSGWRFFAGNEDDAYANNPDNVNVFKINTICNYDADIIPYLSAEYGSAFIRVDDKNFISDDGTEGIFISKQK